MTETTIIPPLPPLTVKQLARPLTYKHLDDITTAVAIVLGPLLKRIAELEANQFKDCGVWREGMAARKNNGVTFEGSFWIAQRATMARPGTDDSWRLAVKRGKDGR